MIIIIIIIIIKAGTPNLIADVRLGLIMKIKQSFG